ncbi:DUF4209 domain-containing protein [Herbaspirillum sp. alder98]|uniref:DUF4209 domain-containing protein n=1 Tax=Herbaspirillum sp. alder98 TaxID=2913096 RepID=UPI001CD89392|nr:DUF4209 domain-containing protein [Herbaspirillum sp. alder98]MCA1325784.1 DUF4209 domain-containing protein [Herbaspirillum sp. alder98]
MPIKTIPAIDAVIQKFNVADVPLDFYAVIGELSGARNALEDEELREAAYVDLAIFLLNISVGNTAENPWNCYFRPGSSATGKDGAIIYFPDISYLPAGTIDYWSERAAKAVNQTMKARYADAAWELTPIVEKGRRRNIDTCKMAIDAYLSSARFEQGADIWDGLNGAKRAIDLAATIRDSARVAEARAVLLELHRRDMGWWHQIFDYLMDNKMAGLTDKERAELVGDVESILLSNASVEPGKFNPHGAEMAGGALARYYGKLSEPAEVKRVHIVVAKVFEHAATLGKAQLAASFLQTSLNQYVLASEPAEAERVRILMQEKIRQSHDEMGTFTTRTEISKEEIEKFIGNHVVDSDIQTLANITMEFLPRIGRLRARIQDLRTNEPLFAMLTQELVRDNMVAAKIGGVDDDPGGRLLQEALKEMQFRGPWLNWVVDAAIKKFDFKSGHFVAWANRGKLFEKDRLSLLQHGFEAWLHEDHVTALHVLIPQIEHAFRELSARVGKATTKPYGAVPGTSVAINMGDVVFANGTMDSIGPVGEPLKLYLQALYVDPRGWNLRNRFAHGLLGLDDIAPVSVLWLVHTTMFLGMVMQFVEKHQSQAAEAGE